MTTHTTTTIELTESGAVINVRVELCGAPRKAAPRIVDTYAEPLEDWGNVVQLADRRVA